LALLPNGSLASGSGKRAIQKLSYKSLSKIETISTE